MSGLQPSMHNLQSNMIQAWRALPTQRLQMTAAANPKSQDLPYDESWGIAHIYSVEAKLCILIAGIQPLARLDRSVLDHSTAAEILPTDGNDFRPMVPFAALHEQKTFLPPLNFSFISILLRGRRH